MEGPRKSFELAFCECGYFQLVERLPRELLTAGDEKIVNQSYMDNVVKILHNTPLAPETTKLYTIEVQVSEVTSIWLNGTMWLQSQRKVAVFKRYSRWKESTSDTH